MTVNNPVLNYLENLSKEEKEVLGALRNEILQLVPEMEERLSRGVPFFYYKGKRAVGFRSSKTHLSFFIMEGNVMKAMQQEIAHLDVSSTVIRFSVEHTLPLGIVEKLVWARIREIENQCNDLSKRKSLQHIKR